MAENYKEGAKMKILEAPRLYRYKLILKIIKLNIINYASFRPLLAIFRCSKVKIETFKFKCNNNSNK